VLFEFWRRNRDRVSALALIDTKAQPDTPEGRAGRLQSAADVLRARRGTIHREHAAQTVGEPLAMLVQI